MAEPDDITCTNVTVVPADVAALAGIRERIECPHPATTVYDGAALCERHANLRAGERQAADEARYTRERWVPEYMSAAELRAYRRSHLRRWRDTHTVWLPGVRAAHARRMRLRTMANHVARRAARRRRIAARKGTDHA